MTDFRDVAPGKAIAAIVAAAGRSTRMGAPKQLLPWSDSTVLAAVVRTLSTAGADPVVVVVGHKGPTVTASLQETEVEVVTNHQYATGELLQSFQVGLRELAARPGLVGTLLALGDQPHIPEAVITQIIAEAKLHPSKIIVPSYNMRRGHPVFLPLSMWDGALALDEDSTLRTLFDRYRSNIRYVTVADEAVLRDLDTPDDYEALKPARGPTRPLR